MANKRIKDLSTTAAVTASDDFIAVDGATNGTRKLDAYNPTFGGNLTVNGTTGVTAADIILGTSGPSVKSTLSARAPRQGLVFDGSGSNGTFTAVPIGSGNFTVSALVNITSYLATGRIISRGSAWEFGVYSDGRIYLYNNTTVLLSTSLVPIGKACLVSYTKSGSSGTFYLNGISAGTVTDNNTYTSASEIGGNSANNAWLGTIQSFLIYNRALSASEVVALYEAGAPAGADYNSASNTAVNVATTTNSGYDTFSGASASGFTAVKTSTGAAASAYSGTDISLVPGQRVRVTFTCTLTSGTLPVLYLSSTAGALASVVPVSIAAGSNSLELTCTTANSAARVRFFNDVATTVNYAISSLSITRIGLLLAPDAAQAGGGLTWYDTSGNAANITLPASGVSWNVPSSQKTASGWTYNGTLSVVNTSTTGILKLQGANGYSSTEYYNASAVRKWTTGYDGSNDNYYWAAADGSTAAVFKQSGNVLIGTTTDSGQKLQVAGTVYFSGDLYSNTAGSTWGADSGATGFLVYGAGGGGNANKLVLRTNSTAALTLDSSQNATFAGKITANGAGSTFKGTATNDSAAAGYVGEYVSSRGTSVALTSNTNTNVTSISLTAGDWDVEGSILISPSGTLTLVVAGVSSTSATYETTEDGATYLQTTFGAGQSQQLSTGARRYSLSATTTIYLVSKGAFASGTTTANGVIRARRVR